MHIYMKMSRGHLLTKHGHMHILSFENKLINKHKQKASLTW